MKLKIANFLLVGVFLATGTVNWAKEPPADLAHARLERTNLLEYVRGDGRVQPVKTAAAWEKRRELIVQNMETVMGPLPGREKRSDLELRVEEEVDCGSYLRRMLTYASEPGARVPAYLLLPKRLLEQQSKAPAILCLHQTHSLGHKVVVGLGNSPGDEYAVELVQRGYVCLAPAYPLLANYHPDLKQLGYQSGTMKAIWDNIRGLDLLESLPYVKRGRFGAIGHSLGGHNAVYTAGFDQRIKVVVSSCGLDSFKDYMDGKIAGWTSERYMPKLGHYALDQIPFDFHEVIGALAPRVCLISAPIGDTNFKWRSVDAVAAAARPVYALYRAPRHLMIEHPDCGHEFPRALRLRAYELFDIHLR